MPGFSTRAVQEEWMDDLNCHGPVVEQTLRELDIINRWLGGNGVTVSGLSLLLKGKLLPRISVADLGCGSGAMLKIMARYFAGRRQPATLLGIDANPHIVAYARQHVVHSAITFECVDIFSENFKAQPFDIITATLFTHHFSKAQLVDMLRQWHRQARVGIVINDIHRHPLAFFSIRWLTRLFSKSPMVQFDAPLSVLRAFRRQEWEEILHEAGIVHFHLHWCWAFRWQLVIPASSVNQKNI
jgi:2-polyprenyl-3-methyl-5-hydroxy-6-metoxy-1,4-benzoquinol methylase